MTRPASSFFGIAGVSLMIRRAKVLVRVFNSIGFMRRTYKPNRQSAIGNRQFQNELRQSTNALAAAGGSASADRLSVVVGTRAAAVNDDVHSSAIASGFDCGRFHDPPENPRGRSGGGGVLFDCRAGKAAMGI